MKKSRTRATIGLTAILMVLPNAFWKGESSNRRQIRVEVRAAETTKPAAPSLLDEPEGLQQVQRHIF